MRSDSVKGNISYAMWMTRVDNVLMHLTGLDSGDLPDVMWMDEYEAGATPREAIENQAERLEIEEMLKFERDYGEAEVSEDGDDNQED